MDANKVLKHKSRMMKSKERNSVSPVSDEKTHKDNPYYNATDPLNNMAY